MIKVILVFLFIAPYLSYAQTYMCKLNGQVVFQDKPCTGVLNKTDGELCSESLSTYRLTVESGQASPTEKMCYSKKVAELEKAQKMKQKILAEKEEKEKREKIRAERIAKAEEAREKRIAAELKASREAADKRKKLLKETKAKGLFFVEYRVTGSAPRANITMQGLDGTEQHEVYTDWDWWMQASSGKYLYIAAQNDGRFGDVTTEIWVNGIKVKTATSTQEYGIATVSGRL